ncbi:hypothetical protein [Aquabacterium sp.]
MIQLIARIFLMFFFIYLIWSTVGFMFLFGLVLLAVIMGLAAPKK